MKSIYDKNQDFQQIDTILSDMGILKPTDQESRTEIPARKPYVQQLDTVHVNQN